MGCSLTAEYAITFRVFFNIHYRAIFQTESADCIKTIKISREKEITWLVILIILLSFYSVKPVIVNVDCNIRNEVRNAQRCFYAFELF